jgi:hypothetical protein
VSSAENEPDPPVVTSNRTLERSALLAEIIGSIAVVFSVAYLAVQVADSNKLLRSQGHYNGLELTQRPLEMMIENENLARVIADCDEHPDTVSKGSWYRCSSYYLMQFNGWEYLYYQHNDGSIPSQLWNGADGSFKYRVATRPGYRRFWAETQLAFDEPFKSYLAAQFAMPE